jgi:hypothetical protein
MIIPSSPVAGAAIWPADWSQFIPDTLSALLTGAVVGTIVGIILYRWQRDSEARSERRIALASWRVARATFALSLSASWNPQAGASSLPQVMDAVAPVRALGPKHDIPVWAEAAPDNVELQSMAQLLIDIERLQGTVTELHQSIAQSVSRQGVQGGFERIFMEVAAALAMGFDDSTQVLGLDVSQYVEVSRKAIDDAEVAPRVATFRVAYERVRKNYSTLRDSLLKD